MYRKLKFNDPNTKVFIGSDFHFYHDKDFLYKPRGFTNIHDHNEWIIQDVNKRIGVLDTLIFLGDFLLNAPYSGVFEALLARINCQNIYFIWGNHNAGAWEYYEKFLTAQFKSLDPDLCYCSLRERSEIYPLKIGKVTFLGRNAEVEIQRQSVTLSHFPYAIWNKSHHGTWNLCGHSHGTNPTALPDYKKGKILDCGVDVAKKYLDSAVFSWDNIKEIMNKKEILLLDHHTERTT